jgi:hypothetical protein
MHRAIKGSFSFGLTIGAIILLLKIMNWLPMTVQKETLRPYGSIEQVRAALQIRDVYIPSYFPQNIAWPPAKILAQGEPFTALVMEFKRADKDEVILVLSQSTGGPLKAGNPLELSSVNERAPFIMNGENAVLTVGECGRQEQCSMITWNKGGYTITALMRSAPFELTRIAASMHP